MAKTTVLKKQPPKKPPVKPAEGRGDKIQAPKTSGKSPAVKEAEAELNRIVAEPGDLRPDQLDYPFSQIMRGSDMIELTMFIMMGIGAYLDLPVSDERKLDIIARAKSRIEYFNILLAQAKKERP